MAKNNAGKQEDTSDEAGSDVAAENAVLRAKLEALQAELSAKKGGGALVSAAELAQMLGTDNPNVRQTEAARHPVTGKPYFNDLRPTGRA